MILETVVVGGFGVNCYILAAHKGADAIIIDPGDDEAKIKQVLSKNKLKAAMIINTHGHIDHIGCDDKFGVPVYIHRGDLPLLKNPQLNLSTFLATSFDVKAEAKILEDKDKIGIDQIQLEVLHTPGHTPGGICLLMHKSDNMILFSGDTLFYQSVGRTDFPGADGRQLAQSIKEKLLNLEDDTVVYPGHGMSSTIGEERRNNPFL